MPSAPLNEDSHLYLVDASAYIFRAYHALPPLTRKSDGLSLGAVSGFCNMLFQLLERVKGEDAPTHFACVFDASSYTFRNDLYPDYKANRSAPPADLVEQFPLVRQASRAFGTHALELEGYEADDLIASYARIAREAGSRVTIVSSDKDLMQLVDARIEMLDTMKNKRIGVAEVEEKFGVTPSQVISVQALAGDSTDNIPGAPGIGVKTAAKLLAEYGDLDTLLERAEEVPQKKRRETLIEFADQIRISRELVTLKDDVAVPAPAEALAVGDPDPQELLGFLEEMEFRTITRRVREQLEEEGLLEPGDAPLPSQMEAPVEVPIDTDSYETVRDVATLEAWIAEAKRAGLVAVDTETDGLDQTAAGLVGVSLATAPGRACYIPLAHVDPEAGKGEGEGGAADGTAGADMFEADPPRQIAMAAALERLKPLLEDPSVLKVGQNFKFDLVVLNRLGITVAPFEDTMLISYVLNAGLHGHGMDQLSERYLGHTPIPFKAVAGTGKKQVTFDRVPLEKATPYAAEDADITLRLYKRLQPRLIEDGLITVYERLERPLVPVVAAMELEGIKVDREALSRLSADFSQTMARLEAEAYELVGRPFKLGSPKQLGEILFDEMALPGGKKTKTGAWQTGADILETLAAEGHALPRLVVDWRTVSKLRSTYTEALQAAINADTGRVHTNFSLAAAQTGRLSSTDPNLQNIPIRTEEGARIREAFIAEPGHCLLSADYSQIELRLLAHMAEIDVLRDAFREGLDIHAMTASEMFGVPVEGMDPKIRRSAKAINFGIIYGISGFGLARQLAIPRDEASDYIKQYFKKFPGIRAFMDETKAFARNTGFVSTLFGRRLHVADIKSKNGNARAFAERQATNAPIQGTAADIIKRAMIRMPAALKEAGLSARMLLQVHDELVFEVPDDEVDATKDTVRRVMERAHQPVLDLAVPLVVEADAGRTWGEAH